MKKNLMVFVLAIAVLSGCTAEKNGENDTVNLEVSHPTQTPSATPAATEFQREDPTASAEPSPEDEMRKQIDALGDLYSKILLAEYFYQSNPEAALPIIKELAGSLDDSAINSGSARIYDFVPILLNLDDAGEVPLFKDLLQRLFMTLPIGVPPAF